MGQAEDQAAVPQLVGEIEGIGQRCRQRLVADHMDARRQKGRYRGVMDMIGRDDGNDVDAIGPPGLGFGHRRKMAVGAIGGNAEFGRAHRSPFPIGRQRAGDEFIAIVQAGGDPVDGTDESARPTAHHAQAQPPRADGRTPDCIAHI